MHAAVQLQVIPLCTITFYEAVHINGWLTPMASAWAVIEEDRKVLLVQRSNSTSRPSQWCFPGGGIRAGESAETACVREVHEEVGLKAQVTRNLLSTADQTYFLCRVESNLIQLDPSECQAFAWVEPRSMLRIGAIMELRKVVQVLKTLGYEPELPDEFIANSSQ